MVFDAGSVSVNGGIVPLLLLGFTIALMLMRAARRTLLPALAGFAVAAVTTYLFKPALAPTLIFAGLWTAMILAAATLFLAPRCFAMYAVPLFAGFWLGSWAQLNSDFGGVTLALVVAASCVPAQWLGAGKFEIILKVVASWMIAIATLSMFVSLLPTPGYEPDHMQ